MTASRDLFYSTRRSTRYSVIIRTSKDSEKDCMCAYVSRLTVVQHKSTHWDTTIPQQNLDKWKKERYKQLVLKCAMVLTAGLAVPVPSPCLGTKVKKMSSGSRSQWVVERPDLEPAPFYVTYYNVTHCDSTVTTNEFNPKALRNQFSKNPSCPISVTGQLFGVVSLFGRRNNKQNKTS